MATWKYGQERLRRRVFVAQRSVAAIGRSVRGTSPLRRSATSRPNATMSRHEEMPADEKASLLIPDG
jgi:hypothetical protein